MSENEKERIVAEVFIAGSAEAVWHEITKTDEAQGCFFNAWMHTNGLRVGGVVAMRDESGKYTMVVGEILEFEPPRRFAHTFRFTQYDDAECRVVYTIEDVEGGVLFRLCVEDVEPGSKTAKSMKSGAKMIVKSLKRIVEKGALSLGLRIGFTVMGWLGPLLTPSRCKTEHWPLQGGE